MPKHNVLQSNSFAMLEHVAVAITSYHSSKYEYFLALSYRVSVFFEYDYCRCGKSAIIWHPTK